MARKEFTLELPLRILFQSPTLAGLAESIDRIRHEGVSSIVWSPLVPIKTTGSKHPLFLVHDWTGSVAFLSNLASHLDVNRPLYGLQAPCLEDPTVVEGAYGSLEAMAAHYIQVLSAVQSEGPYFVGGYSYGGHVAFEMARQLVKRGDQVAWVGILDSVPAGTLNELDFDDSRLWVSYVELRDRKAISSSEFDFASLQDLQGEERLRKTVAQLHKTGRMSAAIDLSAVQGAITRIRERMNNLSRYVPDVYPSQITLFITKETLSRARSLLRANDNTGGWSRLCTEAVRVFEVAGDHHHMIVEPYVRTLADKLNASLEEIQKTTPKWICEPEEAR